MRETERQRETVVDKLHTLTRKKNQRKEVKTEGERGREGGRDRDRERGREGGRDRDRERGREGGRDRDTERGRRPEPEDESRGSHLPVTFHLSEGVFSAREVGQSHKI